MSLVEKYSVYSEQKRHYRSVPKKVGLDLTLTFKLAGDARFCTKCVPYEVGYDWTPVLKGLPYRVGCYSDGPKSSWAPCETGPHGEQSNVMTSIVIKFWLQAEDDKPSKTVSESKAVRLITNKATENEGKPWSERLSLEEIISARIQAVLDAAQEQKQAYDIARQANHLITHALNTARERAKTNTDFDAKLEALKAEFEAEQEACLAAYLKDELAADCAEEDAEEAEDGEEKDAKWHPRALELAAEKADECLPAAIRSFMGRSGNCEKVKMADVFPKVEVEEIATPV